MKFNTIGELYLWLKKYEMCILDSGSQGICYRVGNKVYKIFLQFIDEISDDMIEYDKDEILKFSSITNNTYIFPNDVIMVRDMVVGYITDYVNAKSLDKIDPLSVNLDMFEKKLEDVYPDIKIISDNGVRSFDVIYNILYGKSGFRIVDMLEYTKTDMDSMELYRLNKKNFNIGIKLFLTDNYFDQFLLCNDFLYSMYCDPCVDMILFLKEFRKKLSEKEGFEIVKLGDAKKSVSFSRKKNPKYIRGFY